MFWFLKNSNNNISKDFVLLPTEFLAPVHVQNKINVHTCFMSGYIINYFEYYSETFWNYWIEIIDYTLDHKSYVMENNNKLNKNAFWSATCIDNYAFLLSVLFFIDTNTEELKILKDG